MRQLTVFDLSEYDKSNTQGVIKVCGDPHCEAVYHNVPPLEKRCKDCGARIMRINHQTYKKKYARNYFQYDYQTMEYIHN